MVEDLKTMTHCGVLECARVGKTKIVRREVRLTPGRGCRMWFEGESMRARREKRAQPCMKVYALVASVDGGVNDCEREAGE